MTKLSLCTIGSIAAIAICLPLNAQRETGSIAGTITDSSNAAVAGAKVLVRDTATGVERVVTSNEAGMYVVNALPASTYSITVSQDGFNAQKINDFTLQVGQSAAVNVNLKVGSVSETVTVAGTAAVVETRAGTLTTEISTKQITDLPLNGRNVLQLLAVTPGTLNTNASAFNQGATRPESASQLVSVSGGRGNSTTFTLDGGIHEDPYTEVANVAPNPDAIQEFSYATNSYSAKFGGRGGGVVNIITRSGTNQVHGSLFEYLRNAELNARNFFGTANDGLKRNQYGASVGGPILRNRLFFFGSWQGNKARSRPTTASAIVPTAAQRRGDWSATRTQLVDPRSGLPIPGNQIPASQLNQAAQNFLKLIPAATSPDGFYPYVLNSKSDGNQYLGRVDYYLGERQRFSGRYFFDSLIIPSLADPTTTDGV